MVKTSSTMLKLGSLMPSFNLPVVAINSDKDTNCLSLKRINSNMLSDKPVLLMILCAHCPFVKHIEGQLTDLEEDFGKYVQFLGIASNCIDTYPLDGPEFLAKQKLKNRWNFPYLLDLDQNLAKSLRAACTPEFFLFAFSSIDQKHKLKYRGQLDASRPNNNIPTNGYDLRSALDAVLNFQKVSTNQQPSIGCNIKWRKGFEPSWFY